MRLRSTLAVCLVFGFTACKKPDAPASASAPAAAAGPSCATAADRLVTLAFAAKPGSDSDPAKDAKATALLRSTVVTHCTDDKWADAFIACVAGAQTGNDLDPCMKGPSKLDKGQQDKLIAAVTAAADQIEPGGTKKYLDKSKETEAKLNLNHLGKNAKVYFIANAEFPKGDAATLPAAPCCSQPDHKCAPSTAWATDKVWSALDFALDEPSRFQYSYHSDGTTFTATAVGDLDCDGKVLTYSLAGSAAGGNPTAVLTEPAGSN